MNGPQLLAGAGWPALLRGQDAWRWLVLALLLAAGIGLRSPWPADEPRFALAALDMVENGHWLLPHRGGEVYADKPPLFMWLQALLYLATGNMRVAFLLPSFAAALATLALVHDLARRLYDREAAWFVVLLLLVTVQFGVQARSAQIDMCLTAFTTLGLYGLCRHLLLGPARGWWALGWLAMGAGIITKGVGFLPVLALPGWLAVRGRLPARVPADSATLAAPLLLLLPAALWLLPLVVGATSGTHPEYAPYLREILLRQTVTRYADGLGHVRPAWYYLVSVVPGLWLPLSVLLPWLLPDWLSRLRLRDPPTWLLASFLLLGLLFFSLSPGKRGVYVLPLLPAAALLAAGSLQALADRRRAAALLRGLTTAVGVLLLMVSAATYFDLGPVSEQIARAELPAMPAMLFLAAAGAAWTLCAVALRGGAGFTLAMLLTWLQLGLWGYPLLDATRSASGMMSEVVARLAPGEELAIVGFREQQLLQADRPVIHWSYHAPAELQAAAAAQWLADRERRRVLIAERAAAPCFADNGGVAIGFRHRRLWRLMTADDVRDTRACDALRAAGVADGLRQYRAPYLRYATETPSAHTAVRR